MSDPELKKYPLYNTLSQLLNMSRPDHEYSLCVIEAEETEAFNFYQDQLEEIIGQRDYLLSTMKRISKSDHAVGTACAEIAAAAIKVVQP